MTGGPMRARDILLVDDDEIFLFSLSEGLRDPAGKLKVHTAGNGRQALEVLGSRAGIELLVTDLKMPEMDGFALLTSVRRDFPSIRAMAMTSFITPEAEEHLKTMGVLCIEKAAGLTEMRSVIMFELLRPSG